MQTSKHKQKHASNKIAHEHIHKFIHTQNKRKYEHKNKKINKQAHIYPHQ